MCGIFAYHNDQADDSSIDKIRRIILETKIRGMHATGVSYLKSGSIITEIQPVSADIFLKNFDLKNVIDDGKITLIGHCRYSTSDLEYNQPIFNSQVSIAHNGVISQELPEMWESLYGYRTKTKNDSELALKTIEDGKEPLEVWRDASIAICELHSSGKIKFYRNGQRPLHYIQEGSELIVSSVKSILDRCGLTNSRQCISNMIYEKDQSYMINIDDVEDLQFAY